MIPARIDVYHHFVMDTDVALTARFDQIDAAFAQLIQMEKDHMSSMSDAMTALKDRVTQTNGTMDSAMAFIKGLETQLAGITQKLADSGVSDTDLADLKTVTSTLSAHAQPLAAAIVTSPGTPTTSNDTVTAAGGTVTVNSAASDSTSGAAAVAAAPAMPASEALASQTTKVATPNPTIPGAATVTEVA